MLERVALWWELQKAYSRRARIACELGYIPPESQWSGRDDLVRQLTEVEDFIVLHNPSFARSTRLAEA